MNTKKIKKALGPLAKFYESKSCHEFSVWSYDRVSVEENGALTTHNDVFSTKKEYLEVIDNLLELSGRKKDDYFNTNFSLDQNTRVNIALPPMAPAGPALTLLKIPEHKMTWKDLVNYKAIREEGVETLKKIIHDKKSILVAGNAGSGKTTVLNLICAEVPNPQWMVVVEQVKTMNFERDNTCFLQAPNNKVGELEDTIRVAGRMRADVIAFNQFTGPEALSFIELIREGHQALASIAGENVFDAIKRLEFQCLSASPIKDIELIRYGIAQAFDYLVFQERKPEGNRVLTRIVEIKYQDGQLKLDPVYSA